MIDWKKYPKSTRASICYWIDDMLIANEEFDRPTQTKTVADVVEWMKAGNEIAAYKIKELTTLVYCVAYDNYHFVSQFSDAGKGVSKHYQVICTRAEFEAYAKEQEGEKWTHTYMDGNCLIACNEQDMDGWICILREDSGYDVVNPAKVKPIKPKLTKAEAWDKLMQNKMNSAEVNTLKQQYDII